MLLEELKAIVGPDGWTTDPEALQPHLTERRGIVVGRTPVMLAPQATAQVGDIVRACRRHGTGIVPQGGNTGLCGGAIPDASGSQVLLSLARLDRIRAVDPDGCSITVEAGCILANVQAAARRAGCIFPLSFASEGSCQIGGNLSTNAGGMNVIRYGTARQQVLGLEVVLADGTTWDGLRSLHKDTAGYDLKQLFIGSEGTLGIITAATLRLYSDPGSSTTALVAIDSASDAVRLLGALRKSVGNRVNAFELMSDRCLSLVARHIPDSHMPFDTPYSWYVLTDITDDAEPERIEAALAGLLDAGLAGDAIVTKNEAEADKLWRLRHAIPDAQRPEGACLKHDISVPIACLAQFLDRALQLIETHEPEARLVAFGHVGDGNLHYNVLQPVGGDGDDFRRRGQSLTASIYDLVTVLGGSVSAEHGIGVVKKGALLASRSDVEIGLMRTVKQALDPENILNPGKVI